MSTDKTSVAKESDDASTTAAMLLEQQMQTVMELMDARAKGLATNEQVEVAVAIMLRMQRGEGATVQPLPPVAKRKAEPEIQLDTEDYDELEDDEEAPSNEVVRPSSSTSKASDATQAFEASQVPEPLQKKSSSRKLGVLTKGDIEVDWSVYDNIPLGKQGAQMMTSFGDGKVPVPAAVSATLQGTRRMLQTAIQDARHVRRKQKVIYKSAKNSLKVEQPQKPTMKSEWSAELLFRAGEGYDPIAYDLKCGFGIEDLRQLFPEEMNAYSRWNEMHEAVEEKGVADVEADGEVPPPTEPNDSIPPVTKPHESSDIIGHLYERAAQFDLRTEKMPEEWYLKYSILRQGSFLPRRRKGQRSSADETWEASRKHRKQGERRQGVWAHMSATAVRFLHWVGFEPASALPPPNEDVTFALAFLGYDFFGRIVEKAIFLRNVEKQTLSGKEINEAAVLLELDPGEQLEENDICRAMEDPDIKPVPLYSSATNKKLGPMLYFGPGFENRLEMEMDEMIWSSKKLSDDELKIRQEEDKLFAQLAKPPKEDGIAALLAAREDRPGDANDSGTANKIRRTK